MWRHIRVNGPNTGRNSGGKADKTMNQHRKNVPLHNPTDREKDKIIETNRQMKYFVFAETEKLHYE